MYKRQKKVVSLHKVNLFLTYKNGQLNRAFYVFLIICLSSLLLKLETPKLDLSIDN